MYNPPLTPFQKVQKGTAWLHAHSPGWRKKIDTVKLDLKTWGKCVLGQLFTFQELGELIVKQEKTFLQDCGFCVMSEEENQSFVKEWKEICC
jgi:hypothetical protein